MTSDAASLSVRPRRSALYLPAGNARALEKARTLPCDVVILDLEDAVAPDAKAAAREAAVTAVKAKAFGHREVVIRVNALGTPWAEDDLAAAAQAGPDAILAPKVSRAADVAAYHSALAEAPADLALWAMIETPAAIFHLWELGEAAATSRLAAFVVGLNDLAKDMRARQTNDRAAFQGMLALTVAAARGNGLAVLDAVSNAIDAPLAFEAACRQGRDLGFDGKTLIHPSQIDTANAVFAPGEEDLNWSRAVIDAFADPANAGLGVLKVAGRMAERLHLVEARRLVAMNAAIAARSAA